MDELGSAFDELWIDDRRWRISRSQPVGNWKLLTAQRIVLDTIGFLNESVDQRPVGQFTDEG